MAIQIHIHTLGYLDRDEPNTHWVDAFVNQRQLNMFGQNALGYLLTNLWVPVQPTWADGACTEIRFLPG